MQLQSRQNDRSRPYFIKNKAKKKKRKKNNSEWTVKNQIDITDLRVTRKKVQPLPHWNGHEMDPKKQTNKNKQTKKKPQKTATFGLVKS